MCMLRMSTFCVTCEGTLSTASRRRSLPILMATACAPMLSRIMLGEALRHHPLGRGVDHQRGGVRRRQPVVEPVQPEIRDPRHIDENFRHHDESDGEKQ